MVSIRPVGLLERLRRRPDGAVKQADPADAVTDPQHAAGMAARLPDPSRPPQARGSWENAALTNTRITELVKREIGTITPPWKK